MNLRATAMFAIIFILIVGGIYFSHLVGDVASAYKMKNQIKNTLFTRVFHSGDFATK